MRVALCANQTVRGIEQRLADQIAATSAHEVRVVADRKWDPLGRDVIDKVDAAARNEVLDWADVVHFFGATSPRSWGRTDLLFTPSKKVVWQQFNSWRDREELYSSIWFEGDILRARLAVVSEGWDDEPWWVGREHAVLPPIFPIHDPPYLPAPVHDRVVSFSPKKLVQTLPSPKFVRETVAGLAGCPLDLIKHSPWRACMESKARAWVGIDELATPRIHFSGMEYLILGVPCFDSWDEATERALYLGTGATEFPFMPSSLGSIGLDARRVLAWSGEEWAQASTWVRAWAERSLDPVECARKYLRLYEAP